MGGTQAIDLFDTWRKLLIQGEAERITAMLEDVESRLRSKGFERDPKTEKTMNWHPHQLNKVLCFSGGQDGGPRLLLCLNRATDRRVRGGTLSLADGSSNAGAAAVAAVVNDVFQNVITPSAESFGLRVTYPRLGPYSLVQHKTMAALLAFGDVAAGERLPFSKASEAAWRKLLIAAASENVAFDVNELTEWFVANGWEAGAARSLLERFVSDSVLLAEYAEAAEG